MEKRKGRGRPTRLTRKVIDELALATEQGYNRKTACAIVGVSTSAFNDWIQRGSEEPGSIFSELVVKIEAADEIAKKVTLDAIREHAAGGRTIRKIQERRDEKGNLLGTVETIEELPPSLQASIWILERRFPEEFGPRQKVDMDGGLKLEGTLFGQCCLPGSADHGPVIDSDE